MKREGKREREGGKKREGRRGREGEGGKKREGRRGQGRKREGMGRHRGRAFGVRVKGSLRVGESEGAKVGRREGGCCDEETRASNHSFGARPRLLCLWASCASRFVCSPSSPSK
jgi:hypothetical protein